MAVTSAREAFCAALFNGPLLRADAVVVLAGEDAEARLDMAMGLMAQGAAPVLVLTGKLDEPPAKLGAERLMGMAMAKGLAPDRIRVDAEATNTAEQASNVAVMAEEERWRAVILVASPYHVPRAALTFIRAFEYEDVDVHLIPAPSAQSPWFAPPPGCDKTREELLAVEFAKVDEYAAKGDCATWEEGLAYLRRFEMRAAA